MLNFKLFIILLIPLFSLTAGHSITVISGSCSQTEQNDSLKLTCRGSTHLMIKTLGKYLKQITIDSQTPDEPLALMVSSGHVQQSINSNCPLIFQSPSHLIFEGDIKAPAITAISDHIDLISLSTLDISGTRPKAIHLGSQQTQTIFVDPNAKLIANNTKKGNGGLIELQSNLEITCEGTIFAKGGPKGGNGGIVEYSGTGIVCETLNVDVSAPHGLAGTVKIYSP